MNHAPAKLEYAPPTQRRTLVERGVQGVLVRTLTFYVALCAVTIPFIDSLWVGELPVFALPQVPKIESAHWVSRNVVMPTIRVLGLSRGSASTDHLMTRPYSLAIVYVLPLSAVLVAARSRIRSSRRERAWAAALASLAVVDYLLTLFAGGGPGLTIF